MMKPWSVVLKLNIRSSALPRLAPDHDSEYFHIILEVYLTPSFSKIFCFSDFFGGTGRDRTDRTDRQTNRHMDRQTFLGKYYFRLMFFNLLQYGEQIIYLTSDDSNAQHCRNNGSVITLEMGQRSAVVIRLGRIQHHMDPFLCTLQIKKGKRFVAFHS